MGESAAKKRAKGSPFLLQSDKLDPNGGADLLISLGGCC